jgi:hypothetical protein
MVIQVRTARCGAAAAAAVVVVVVVEVDGVAAIATGAQTCSWYTCVHMYVVASEWWQAQQAERGRKNGGA